MRDGESSDSDSEYGYGYFTECSESSADRTPSHRCSSCDSRSDLSDTDEDSRSDSSEDGGRSCDEGQDQEERDPPEARVEPEKEKVHVHHEPEENQVRAGPHPEGRGEAGPGPGADEAGLHENARRYDADPAVAIRTIAGLPSCPPSRHYLATVNRSKHWTRERLVHLRHRAATGGIHLCERAAGQFETGSDGRLHLHLFLRFANNHRVRDVIRALDPDQTGSQIRSGSGIHVKACLARRAEEAEEYCNKSDNEFMDYTVDRESRFVWDSGDNRKFQAQFENGAQKEGYSKFHKTYLWGKEHVFEEATCRTEVLALCMQAGGGDHMKTIEEAYDHHRRILDGIEVRKRKNKTDGVVLMPWQQRVVNLLNEQDNRKVLRVVNARGNIGKSFLVKYLEDRYPGLVFATDPAKKTADILHAFTDYGNTVETILVDVPRTAVEKFDFALIELFKNGVWTSPKYRSSRQYLTKSPAVCVFSNQMLSLHHLSKDRNITMECWRNPTTREIMYHLRSHTEEEFANSLKYTGIPQWKCPRLDLYVEEDEVALINPSHDEVPRLHTMQFAICWCTTKIGYDICGPLTPGEVQLFYAENGAFADGHAPYAVCPPVNHAPRGGLFGASIRDSSPIGPAAASTPNEPPATVSPLLDETVSEKDDEMFPGSDSLFPVHDMNEEGECLKCGQVYPNNQVCI